MRWRWVLIFLWEKRYGSIFRAVLSSVSPVPFDIQRKGQLDEMGKIKEEFGTRSQLAMAIFPRTGKPWIFGLHQCSYDRVWSDSEIELFDQIGKRLSEGLNLFLLQNQVLEREEQFRTIVLDQTDFISRWSGDGVLSFVNSAYCRQAGKTEQELIGTSFFDLIPQGE